MSKMLWELKAPLVIAKAKEDFSLNNIFKYMRYYRMYIERFKWRSEKQDLTNRIENILFWRGKVAFCKDAVYGLIAGEIDEEIRNPNGELVQVSISAENGYKRKNLEVGKDVVILYADETHFAPVLYIWSIANGIIDVEDIIDSQDNMLRKPIIVTGEGAELDNAMAKVENVLSGVAWFNLKPTNEKGGNVITAKPMEVLNLQVGNAYKGKELWESRGKREELIKDYLGYTSVNNQKKERMIQAEVNQSTSICKTFYDSSVDLRETCVKQIKEVLGEELEFKKILKEEEVKEEHGDNEENMESNNRTE